MNSTQQEAIKDIVSGVILILVAGLLIPFVTNPGAALAVAKVLLSIVLLVSVVAMCVMAFRAGLRTMSNFYELIDGRPESTSLPPSDNDIHALFAWHEQTLEREAVKRATSSVGHVPGQTRS